MDDFSFTLSSLVEEAHLRTYEPNTAYTILMRETVINPYQVDKECDPRIVEALAAWFNDNLIFPEVVFTIHDDRPTLVAGEYAYRAGSLLGCDIVLGRYISGSLRALAWLESIFRENLDNIKDHSEFDIFSDKAKEDIFAAFANLLHLDHAGVEKLFLASRLPKPVKDLFRDGNPRPVHILSTDYPWEI